MGNLATDFLSQQAPREWIWPMGDQPLDRSDPDVRLIWQPPAYYVDSAVTSLISFILAARCAVSLPYRRSRFTVSFRLGGDTRRPTMLASQCFRHCIGPEWWLNAERWSSSNCLQWRQSTADNALMLSARSGRYLRGSASMSSQSWSCSKPPWKRGPNRPSQITGCDQRSSLDQDL